MAFARRRHFAAACIAVLFAACGKGEEKVSQVAAKVNGDEITVHQVNQALQRLGNIPEAQAMQAQKQIVDRLVDQQLLVQQAMEKKLDREPRVLAALEAAKRQILAQAYVEQVMGGAQKATADETKEFYAKHPELFQQRRVYRFAQVAIAAPPDRQKEVRAKLEELDKLADKQKILPQFADWLKAQKLEFRVNQLAQAAEQLPLEALPKYQQMKVGDLIFVPGPQGAVVSQIIAVQSEPLSEQQAQPVIEQFLQNRERGKLSDDEIKRLRKAAKIEFMGEFAKLEQQVPASAGNPAESAPAPGAQAAPAAEPGSGDQDAMAKSLKALK